MDFFSDPCNLITFASFVLALILEQNQSMPVICGEENDEYADACIAVSPHVPEDPVMDRLHIMSSALHSYRLCCPDYPLTDELSYSVKPRSTTWFSRFFLEQHDNSRWLSMFRMTKDSVFSLAELLKPTLQKKNTKYRLAIPVLIRVACTLFKLTHGSNLTVCSEMFAVRHSTVCKFLREVVHAINNTLKHEVSWPNVDKICVNQAKFAEICSLPAVVGAIDGMQVSIAKPDHSAADYYYFKSGGYSMNCQAVVGPDKRFMDMYIGMPGSTNDSRMLRRSTLHYLATHGNIMDANLSVDEVEPYLNLDRGFGLPTSPLANGSTPWNKAAFYFASFIQQEIARWSICG